VVIGEDSQRLGLHEKKSEKRQRAQKKA